MLRRNFTFLFAVTFAGFTHTAPLSAAPDSHKPILSTQAKKNACAHIKPGTVIKSRPYTKGRYIQNTYVTYYKVERISSPSNFVATDIKTVNVKTGETKGRHYGKGVTRNCKDFD
jgi:hypothetical protein